jgi:hypothetical protein
MDIEKLKELSREALKHGQAFTDTLDKIIDTEEKIIEGGMSREEFEEILDTDKDFQELQEGFEDIMNKIMM